MGFVTLIDLASLLVLRKTSSKTKVKQKWILVRLYFDEIFAEFFVVGCDLRRTGLLRQISVAQTGTDLLPKFIQLILKQNQFCSISFYCIL